MTTNTNPCVYTGHMTTAQTETMHDVWVGNNLFHDWESRGILSDSGLQIVKRNKVRVLVRGTIATLNAYVWDADYQMSESHEPSSSTIKTNTTFIERVNAIVLAQTESK